MTTFTETLTIDVEGTRAEGSIPSTFVSQWKTDNTGTSNNDQINLPLVASGTYNFAVFWGDGTSDQITVWNQAEITHTYPIVGTYTVIIDGILEGWAFNSALDEEKLLNISQWGPFSWGNNAGAFNGCVNLTITATDTISMSGVTTAQNAFSACTSIVTIPNITQWDWSAVLNMSGLFSGNVLYNQSLVGINTSSVTNMNGTFNGCIAYNQSLIGWDTSSVTRMDAMFAGASVFDQDIGSLDITSLTNATNMFAGETLSTANYDALLIGWEGQAQQPNVTFSGGNSTYSAGAAATARAALVSDGWTITDGGPA